MATKTINNFKSNLVFLRKKNGFSIDQFSEKVEIPIRFLEQFERGLAQPTLDHLIAIASGLGITVDDLLKPDFQTKEKSFKKKKIDLLVVDIDGVLTDGGLYYSDSGIESKKFNAKDGLAMMALKSSGIKTGILSSGFKPEIGNFRAKTLNTDFIYVGREPKTGILEGWCKQLNIGLENVAFIGDDLNDLEILQKVGLSVCPADAVEKIKSVCHIILTKKGGEGCVREFIDDYLKKE